MRNEEGPPLSIGVILLLVCLSASSVLVGTPRPDGTLPVQVIDDQASEEVVIRNTSPKSIIAMCGTFEVVDPDTMRTHVVRWTRNFPGVFFDQSQFLAPGEEYRFAPFRARNRPDVFLRRLNLRLSALVFADGTTWGKKATADLIRSHVFDRVRAVRLVLLEVRQTLAEHAPDETESLILGLKPIAPAGRKDAELIHLKLRKLLVTDDIPRQVHSDWQARLDKVIAHLGRVDPL